MLKSQKIFLLAASEYIATSVLFIDFVFISSGKICTRPYSHFADRCGSETISVVDRLHVHTSMMLSGTQIVSEYFPQSVTSMKRNKEARKVKFFQ